jgi:SNF family Na+-dependent transporter
MSEKREHWGSRIGFIFAAAGSAVGLGNIWKFPHIAGENGGAAFTLVYLFCILLVGVPIVIGEFAIGRKTQLSPVGAFKKLAPGSWWKSVGFLGVASAFVILSFYSVVGGWTLRYTFVAISGGFETMQHGVTLDFPKEKIVGPKGIVIISDENFPEDENIIQLPIQGKLIREKESLLLLSNLEKKERSKVDSLMLGDIDIVDSLMLSDIDMPKGYADISFSLKRNVSKKSTYSWKFSRTRSPGVLSSKEMKGLPSDAKLLISEVGFRSKVDTSGNLTDLEYDFVELFNMSDKDKGLNVGGYKLVSNSLASKEEFSSFKKNAWNPLFWHLIFIGLCIWIIVNGVKSGIERWSKIMMPAILLILVMLVIRGITLKNGVLGLEFLFKPKFSDLTANSVVLALGHSFFTLSLGMGTMITYGSYLKKDQNLLSSAFWVILLDTAIAMLAGIAIFTTVFALGADPAGGPGLIFHVLPSVFSQLPGGTIWGTMFFFLLFLAALTSAISILEVVTAYFIDQKGWSRAKATVTFGGVAAAVGIFVSLSFGDFNDMNEIFKISFFEMMDYASSKYMLPIGGMLTALFIIWRWGVPAFLAEIYEGTKGRLVNSKLATFLLGIAAFIVFAIIFNELVALFAGESLSEILFGPVG